MVLEGGVVAGGSVAGGGNHWSKRNEKNQRGDRWYLLH
jgi:hypothetical protein